MGGESLNSAVVNSSGLAGDRCWAVLNGETREICLAKRWPDLLNYRAELLAGEDLQSSGFSDEVPDVHIHCPGGKVIAGRESNAEAFLSSEMGKQVCLSPLVHPSDKDHYRLAKARTDESMAMEMQLLEGEAFPDISSTPDELMNALAECVTPPGTYVDAYPLHMVTTNSLQYLSELGKVDAVKGRFRPNLLIEPSKKFAELTENSWLDCRVQVGEAVLRIHSRTVRCSMPSREQQWCGIKAEAKMARAMVDHCDRHLGVNVMVEKGGVISAGDELALL
ncbi:MOSC domain-containing protein [Pseudohalioglobus lutimaris]|uniref:MOSC domain-containing protein n=2 Tax=Pseudohalioglobus lutimaris TaxID=1737061 RepID=A0A2N5X0F4_9GAMM|nr:MOSC domain-containing protein [Pseudohalioglobus lutimaris]